MRHSMTLVTLMAIFSSIGVANSQVAPTGKPPIVMGARMAVTPVLVKDGDTVQVREFVHDIRLASIDSPELGHGRKKPGQAYAQVARKALADLLGNSRSVEAVCYERDRYERPVCDLYADGQSVNRALVASGMAWANQGAGGRYLRDTQLLALEAQAKARGDGLWANPAPVEPWVWRGACWKDGRCIE